MAKVYTAQEIRDRADYERKVNGNRIAAAMLRQAADESESVGKLKSMLHEIAMIADECDECDSYNRTEFCAEAIDRISSVINASADALEREKKREKKWEYAERCPDGFIPPLHTDKGVVKKYIADGCVLVRREVGEWEEVK